jgi:hypothetical protein
MRLASSLAISLLIILAACGGSGPEGDWMTVMTANAEVLEAIAAGDSPISPNP